MKEYKLENRYDYEVYEDRTDHEFMQKLIDLADAEFEENRSQINKFINTLST